MIETERFAGRLSGPALLLLGGVHGDEKPGTLALERLVADLRSGAVAPSRGSVVVVPRVNAEACAAGKHAVDENLNRIVFRHENPVTLEQRLANELLPLFDAADVVLDLHSAPAPTRPFAFLDEESPEIRAWADALGVDFLVAGWPALYAGAGHVTTTEQAKSRGKRGLTVEVGQNDDPAGAERGYLFALRTLAHFGLIEPVPAPLSARRLRLTQVVRREREGAFARPWENFDRVAKGEAVARYADGVELLAEADAFVIMPYAAAALGEEWYYLAVES